VTYGVRCEIERGRGVLTRFSLGDKMKDLAFERRELFERRAALRAEDSAPDHLDKAGGDRGTEIRFAPADGVERFEQTLVRGRFFEIRVRACTNGIRDRLLVVAI